MIIPGAITGSAFVAQNWIDPQKRIALFHQIGQRMYDQTLIIPLHNDPDLWAVNRRLTNVEFSGVAPLMFAYQWDVK